MYLKGIEVEGKKYYTNQDKDTETIDLKYVYGIKIPDDYKYESGDKKEEIIISNKSNNLLKYKWIDTKGTYKIVTDSATNTAYVIALNKVDTIENRIKLDLSSEDKNIKDLEESTNEYGGIYLKISETGEFETKTDNTVENIYLPIDYENSWSSTYDEEGIYKDQNGDIAYIPKGFKVSRISTMNTIKSGLVIKNASNDMEFVWINVPKSALQDKDGNEPNSADEIEKNLINYVKEYREEGYSDEWYDGAIKPKEGDVAKKTYNELKNKMLQYIKDKGGFWISRYEVSNSNIVENNITYASAIEKAVAISENLGIGEQNKTSLLFGIQWDLVCKFISENEIKASDEEESVLNIYNFIGNYAEYTLEYNSKFDDSEQNKSVARGGKSAGKMSAHIPVKMNQEYTDVGYRITIY